MKLRTFFANVEDRALAPIYDPWAYDHMERSNENTGYGRDYTYSYPGSADGMNGACARIDNTTKEFK